MADNDIYKSRATAIKTAINSLLINKEGIYTDGLKHDKSQSLHVSQHANVFPMAMGIVPEKNVRQVLTEIKNRKMNMGMVSLRWLPEALGQGDQGPHLMDLYTNTEWDGWAKTIAYGGTVTWETWNADTTNDSMSHPWGASACLVFNSIYLELNR